MKQFLADTAHIIIGALVVATGGLSSMVMGIAAIGFFTYEVIQWIYLERWGVGKSDRPHRAIKYFLIGFIGMALLILWGYSPEDYNGDRLVNILGG